jgi:hypothetical protein
VTFEGHEDWSNNSRLLYMAMPKGMEHADMRQCGQGPGWNAIRRNDVMIGPDRPGMITGVYRWQTPGNSRLD